MDYAGRHTHRVAISNNRLLDIEQGQVSEQKTVTLSAGEFIRGSCFTCCQMDSSAFDTTACWPTATGDRNRPSAVHSQACALPRRVPISGQQRIFVTTHQLFIAGMPAVPSGPHGRGRAFATHSQQALANLGFLMITMTARLDVLATPRSKCRCTASRSSDQCGIHAYRSPHNLPMHCPAKRNPSIRAHFLPSLPVSSRPPAIQSP